MERRGRSTSFEVTDRCFLVAQAWGEAVPVNQEAHVADAAHTGWAMQVVRVVGAGRAWQRW
jgi:hypothetical protein